MAFAASSAKKSKFLPLPEVLPASTGIPGGVRLPDPVLLPRHLQALGEAIYAGDLQDASRHLEIFKPLLDAAPKDTEPIWRYLEKATGGRLQERTEKGILETAIDTPGIPWNETDRRLLSLARALQDGNYIRVEEEKRFFVALFQTGEPIYIDPGLERSWDHVNALTGRLDWENPYVSRKRIGEAVRLAMERLAAELSKYLDGNPPDNDPISEQLKQFFRILSQDQRLMFVADLPGGQVEPELQHDELTVQEEQYLGSNVIFYRQMMASGYLTIFGNIVLGTLALLKDEPARNKFLTAQYRNIRSLARRYDNPGVEEVDLIQTAWIGLQKALEIYQPWRGTLFWPLAKKWVFGAIVLEFKKTTDFTRMTEPVRELEGQSYQDALESLITLRGISGPDHNNHDISELTHDEARQFVNDLVELLDEHDKKILLTWIKTPNIVRVADQLRTSKQNVSNALGRIQTAGRQLAHQRRMMPQAKWERFRRAELAEQSQRLLHYAEKKAGAGHATSRLSLKVTPIAVVPPKPSMRLRPLLAAEKAGLLSIAQRHFDEDEEGTTAALKRYQEVFLSGNEEQVRFYVDDLAQRLDFDNNSFKAQFFNYAILEVFQSLSWRFKTPALAEAVMGLVRTSILAKKEPPYNDVVIAAVHFLKNFPARCKTPELSESLSDTFSKIAQAYPALFRTASP